MEEDSLNDELLNLHSNVVPNIILLEDKQNQQEKHKLQLFIQATNRKINTHNSYILNNTSINSTIFAVEEKPIHRPTTPLSHISSTSNSQIIYYDRKSFPQKMKNSILRKKNSYISDNIKGLENTTDVFKKRDKIVRTPNRSDEF
jgi:hypothetical protein